MRTRRARLDASLQTTITVQDARNHHGPCLDAIEHHMSCRHHPMSTGAKSGNLGEELGHEIERPARGETLLDKRDGPLRVVDGNPVANGGEILFGVRGDLNPVPLHRPAPCSAPADVLEPLRGLSDSSPPARN